MNGPHTARVRTSPPRPKVVNFSLSVPEHDSLVELARAGSTSVSDLLRRMIRNAARDAARGPQ